jgi:hypothetical protein
MQFFFFLFFVILGFELKALHLPGRCSTTWAKISNPKNFSWM